uniref:Uncharacterized protein n=1 Tax=Anguilla anguilla TaxID=7936 RepID=A0A0E9WHM8_ANGAN
MRNQLIINYVSAVIGYRIGGSICTAMCNSLTDAILINASMHLSMKCTEQHVLCKVL